MAIPEVSRVRVVRVERTAQDVEWLAGRLAEVFAGATSVLVPAGGDELPPAVLQDVENRVRWLPAQVSLVVRTSGSTTGTGRLVGLSAAQLRASAVATGERLGGPCTWVLALPPHHIAGLQVVARAVGDGRDVVTVEGHVDGPSVASAVTEALGRHEDGRVAISLVPTQLVRILDDPDGAAALAGCAAVLLGGAAPSTDLVERARALGIAVRVTYGMSETCGGCVYDGVPLDGVQVRLDDGRVLLSGPMLMSGYLDEGPVGPWLATQDLGHWQDGHLVIDGRVDDVINSGGLKIAAGQVLAQIRATGMVRDGVVLGLDDAVWGQVVTAVVVPGRGWRGPEALRELVGRRLGRSHAPRVIAEVAELPMLASGKVDRLEARRIAEEARRSGAAWVR
ncbi:AMP-binding protein [Acidipropionibacterium timonense]|uniref:AMP-binding protein n=1 Tax=Acidipropionibacterium timonense TaxID=2161818 RepID=UPI001AEBABF0|nr:AMP-binding protein [Acidipropionibacterium timonense]